MVDSKAWNCILDIALSGFSEDTPLPTIWVRPFLWFLLKLVGSLCYYSSPLKCHFSNRSRTTISIVDIGDICPNFMQILLFTNSANFTNLVILKPYWEDALGNSVPSHNQVINKIPNNPPLFNLPLTHILFYHIYLSKKTAAKVYLFLIDEYNLKK